jgi:hypothetical protein
METSEIVELLARGYTREQIFAIAAARDAQKAADQASVQAKAKGRARNA